MCLMALARALCASLIPRSARSASAALATFFANGCNSEASRSRVARQPVRAAWQPARGGPRAPPRSAPWQTSRARRTARRPRRCRRRRRAGALKAEGPQLCALLRRAYALGRTVEGAGRFPGAEPRVRAAARRASRCSARRGVGGMLNPFWHPRRPSRAPTPRQEPGTHFRVVVLDFQGGSVSMPIGDATGSRPTPCAVCVAAWASRPGRAPLSAASCQGGAPALACGLAAP